MSAKQVMSVLVAGMAWLSCPPRACAGENHYFAALAWQDENQLTHAFPLLIKTTEEGGKIHLETRVMVPPGFAGVPEQWRTNPEELPKLGEFLRWAHSVNARVTMGGPYPIAKLVYDEGLKAPDRHPAGVPRQSADENRELASYLTGRADASIDPRMAEETLHLLALRGLRPWFHVPGKAPDWLRDRLKTEKYAETLTIQN